MTKDKESLQNELRELSPWLHAQKNQADGFQTPTGYFEQLQEQVFEKLDADGGRRKPGSLSSSGRLRSLFGGLYQARLGIAVAAALTLVLGAWWFFRPAPEAAAVASVELSAEDAEAYLLENLLEFDAEQLAMQLPGDEAVDPEALPAEGQNPKTAPPNDAVPEELEQLLNDMSDEELEELL